MNNILKYIFISALFLSSCDFQMIYEYNVENNTDDEILINAELIRYNSYTEKQISTTVKSHENNRVYIHSPDFFCDKHDFAERLDSFHWNFYYFKVIFQDTIELDFTSEDNWDFISEERKGRYVLTISNESLK